jgi:putative DNA methylase
MMNEVFPIPGAADVPSAIKQNQTHRGWHSRGYLPHFDHPNLVQSINFRLHDSVPADVLNNWKRELTIQEKTDAENPKLVKLRKRIAKYEDAGHGACFLKDPQIAGIIQDALLHFDGQRYCLLAWCIMPNHVHVLAEMKKGYPLDKILHSWKSFTSKEANKILNRTGEFWMSEYFDRFIRDQRHFYFTKEYIENNPVAAGLCGRPEYWQFSSAFGKK